MVLKSMNLYGSPCIGDTVHSPLGRFISFAENDFGYAGSAHILMAE